MAEEQKAEDILPPDSDVEDSKNDEARMPEQVENVLESEGVQDGQSADTKVPQEKKRDGETEKNSAEQVGDDGDTSNIIKETEEKAPSADAPVNGGDVVESDNNTSTTASDEEPNADTDSSDANAEVEISRIASTDVSEDTVNPPPDVTEDDRLPEAADIPIEERENASNKKSTDEMTEKTGPVDGNVKAKAENDEGDTSIPEVAPNVEVETDVETNLDKSTTEATLKVNTTDIASSSPQPSPNVPPSTIISPDSNGDSETAELAIVRELRASSDELSRYLQYPDLDGNGGLRSADDVVLRASAAMCRCQESFHIAKRCRSQASSSPEDVGLYDSVVQECEEMVKVAEENCRGVQHWRTVFATSESKGESGSGSSSEQAASKAQKCLAVAEEVADKAYSSICSLPSFKLDRGSFETTTLWLAAKVSETQKLLQVETKTKQELEEMLVRIEKHFKSEQSLRRSAEEQLDAEKAARLAAEEALLVLQAAAVQSQSQTAGSAAQQQAEQMHVQNEGQQGQIEEQLAAVRAEADAKVEEYKVRNINMLRFIQNALFCRKK